MPWFPLKTENSNLSADPEPLDLTSPKRKALEHLNSRKSKLSTDSLTILKPDYALERKCSPKARFHKRNMIKETGLNDFL